MDETARLLAGSAERVFGAARTAEATGGWDEAAWQEAEAAGFPLAMVSEERSGFALAGGDALQVVRIAARNVVPLPLAETMVANWLADVCGLESRGGISTIAIPDATAPLRVEKTRDGWHLSGVSRRVPYGRHAASVLVSAVGREGPVLCLVDEGGWTSGPSSNMAGEPRDDLFFETSVRPDSIVARGDAAEVLMAVGAAARTVQMAGALERALDETVTYARDRVQFGRPIAKFQAIQQNIAFFAATVAAAGAAADLAAEALVHDIDVAAIAAAKSRVGEAAGTGASIAHQVHGAIGFTYEHPLHLATRKLWAWRDEFGNESWWNRLLGERLIAGGGDRLWPSITALGTPRTPMDKEDAP